MPALNTIWEYSFIAAGLKKKIRIQIGDICTSSESFDILVCSAFKNDYIPTPRSLIGSLLFKKNISVQNLAQNPSIDFKAFGCWLSQPTSSNFHRIACVELIDYHQRQSTAATNTILKSSFATFRFLLEQANIHGIPVKSVALPILGTGNQNIEVCFVIPPLIQQCLNALNTIPELETITFFSQYTSDTAKIIEHLSSILLPDTRTNCPDVFISYSSKQDVFNKLLSVSL